MEGRFDVLLGLRLQCFRGVFAAETIRIGELFPRAVMSAAKGIYGEDAIPAVISGHELPKENRHRHAFYLPRDQNDDGRIDRLIFQLPDDMDKNTRRIAERLKRLWSHDGGEWQVVLENIGEAEAGGDLLAEANEWESVTALSASVAYEMQLRCRSTDQARMRHARHARTG